MEMNTSKCTTEYELSRDGYTRIPSEIGKREYSSRDNSYSAVCIMTYFSNTKYEYTSILAACLIFAGWGFIQWNCYAKLSNQSGGSYSIENVCLLWTFSFWTEPHSVKTSMVGCISKFYFLSCSARSRILYEVEPLLHKTSYVLLPSEQRHVQINLTLALTLFFWLWTGFCPQIGQNWATSDSYSLLLLFRSFCYNEYFRKILFK